MVSRREWDELAVPLTTTITANSARRGGGENLALDVSSKGIGGLVKGLLGQNSPIHHARWVVLNDGGISKGLRQSLANLEHAGRAKLSTYSSDNLIIGRDTNDSHGTEKCDDT